MYCYFPVIQLVNFVLVTPVKANNWPAETYSHEILVSGYPDSCQLTKAWTYIAGSYTI